MSRNNKLDGWEQRWEILYGSCLETSGNGKFRRAGNTPQFPVPGWKPSKSDLRKIAGKRADKIRASGHAVAWARGVQIRYQRTRQGPTKPLCAPQHYKYERHCQTCEAVVLHPNPGGSVRRCMWDKDRERNPKLGGRGGVLVKPHIGPTINELKRGWRNAKKR